MEKVFNYAKVWLALHRAEVEEQRDEAMRLLGTHDPLFVYWRARADHCDDVAALLEDMQKYASELAAQEAAKTERFYKLYEFARIFFFVAVVLCLILKLWKLFS